MWASAVVAGLVGVGASPGLVRGQGTAQGSAPSVPSASETARRVPVQSAERAVVKGGAAGTSVPIAERLTVRDLVQVDQGFADQSPLSVSLRQMQVDLRTTDNFRTLYQVPADAPTRYAGWYARESGGVYALFPRSLYRSTPVGELPLVPAGTRYFIGGIPTGGTPSTQGGVPAGGEGAEGDARLALPIDTRLETRLAAGEGAGGVKPKMGGGGTVPADSALHDPKVGKSSPGGGSAGAGNGGERDGGGEGGGVFSGPVGYDAVVRRLLGGARETAGESGGVKAAKSKADQPSKTGTPKGAPVGAPIEGPQ
jgi:hypothetical protein